MRAITSATAAAALGIDRKTFDSLLSRLKASELPRGRQGVERRIPIGLLPDLLLASELNSSLGVPFPAAFDLARSLTRGDQPATPLVRLEVDFVLLRETMNRELESAIETMVKRP